MRQPAPMPTAPPFISFYTPTFRRPAALARCFSSIGRQTANDDLEQIVIPDHIGYGVANGLYGRLPWYAHAVRGRYVNMLCDDDELASETVVAEVRKFAQKQNHPEVIVVRVRKGPLDLPMCDPIAEPVAGQMDLTSFIVRRDIWLKHIPDYGIAYEGDHTHALAMHRAGYLFRYLPILWAIGGQNHGRAELTY